MTCPFCQIDTDRIVLESKYGVVIRDAFPIFPGHTLVIPKSHINSFFILTKEERNDLLNLLEKAKKDIEKEYQPDAYNIGINDGPDAGQTIPHLHIHLIPRYKGDCNEPKGGIRWINPEKAAYWEIE